MRTQKSVEHCIEAVQKRKVRQIGEIEAQPEKRNKNRMGIQWMGQFFWHRGLQPC